MLFIKTQNHFISEKKYVLDFLFGQNYTLEYHEKPFYSIELSNGSVLNIRDAFFSATKESYLIPENLPKKGKNYSFSHLSKEKVIILYGDEEVRFINDTTISCEVDLMGSIFFMLSRWEEYLPQEYDYAGRIKSENNIAVRFGFEKRPVVEEWKIFLYDIIRKIDPDFTPPQQQGYKLIPSHDVDRIHYPADILNMLGDIKNVRRWDGPFKRIRHKLKGENPYDTFDKLMDFSENAGLKSTFYMMADGKSKFDNTYTAEDNLLKRLVQQIKKRGHLFGMHPGFLTYNDIDEFVRQKKYIEDYTQERINLSRQHYLRFQLKDAITVWEKAGIKEDSSLGFTNRSGFRCGTSQRFKLFNIAERRESTVFEFPLVFMEGSIHSYKNLDATRNQSIEEIQYYKSVCTSFQIPFTFLFHNSSFDEIRWPGWWQVYESVFE